MLGQDPQNATTKTSTSNFDGFTEENQSGERVCKNRVFSQALSQDGALTWQVPPRLGIHEQLSSEIEGNPAINFDDVLAGHRSALESIYLDHLSSVVSQLIQGEGVRNAEVWESIVVTLARQAASLLCPPDATAKGVLDPKSHIMVEVLADVGCPADSFTTQGVVLRRNIAHKGMQNRISNPKVLLLAGALELESSALLQLNTIVQKETAFLESAVSNIVSCKPDVLVVERNIARSAIQELHDRDVTVVCNVPLVDLERLALNMNSQIVESISEISPACLGECGEFKIIPLKGPPKQTGRAARQKVPPLMVFKGCPTDLACSVTLKGDNQEQLERIAHVVKFAAYTAYHLKLELAFLLDEMAVSTASMASVVKEFPLDVDSERWKGISQGLFFNSVRKAEAWRGSRPVTSISPHVAGWSAKEARSPVNQPRDYMVPSFDPTLEIACSRNSTPLRHEISLNPVHSFPLSDCPTPISTMADCPTPISTTEEASAQENISESGRRAPSSRGVMGCPQVQVEQERKLDQSNNKNKKACKEREPPPVSIFGSNFPGGEPEGFAFPSQTSPSSSPPKDGQGSPSLLRRYSGGTAFDPHHSSMGFIASENDDGWRTKEQTSSAGSPSTSAERCHCLLEIYNRQKFTSNFANRNHRRGLLCEPAHVQSIDFYGANDSSLANFLMSIAADATKRCPHGCGGGNSSHVRTFLHGGMRLTVSVVSLPHDKELPGEGELWFWARPKGLGPKPLASIRRILLSPDAKCLSLGQFLDLSCNTPYLEVFGRQLHLEFVRYFGYGRTVACVYQDRIRPNTVSRPKIKLECGLPMQVLWLKEAGNELLKEYQSAYAAIEDALLWRRGVTTYEEALSHEQFVKTSLVPQIQQERNQFLERVEKVVSRVVDNPQVTANLVLDSLLELNRSRRQLAVNVLTWSATLQDPRTYTLPKPQLDDEPDTPLSEIGTQLNTVSNLERSSSLHAETLLESPEKYFGDLGEEVPNLASADSILGPPSPWMLPMKSYGTDEGFRTDGEDLLSEYGNGTDDSGLKFVSPFAALIHRPFSPGSSWSEDEGLFEGRSSNQIHGFDSMKEQSLERFPAIQSPCPGQGAPTRLLRRNSSAGNVLDILENVSREFLQDDESIPATTESDEPRHRRCASDPLSPKGDSLLLQLDRRLMTEEWDPTCGDPEGQPTELSSPGVLGTSPILRLTPQMKQGLKPGVVPLTNGFLQLNGRSLVTPGCDDVVIPIFEAEPASIISHVLASIAYQKELKQCCINIHAAQGTAVPSSRTANSVNSSSKGSGFFEELSSRISEVGDSGHSRQGSEGNLWRFREGSTVLRSKTPAHICQKFEDDPPGMPWSQAKFQVVSYFAPQFGKLRNLCIEGGERSFIMSLSRCRRWKAQGGKSGAYFAKTRDDQYIIKGISKSEKTSFLDNFAPAYFRYMDEAISEDRKVTLAKILGVFQVSMKSKADVAAEGALGKDWVLDVIVMENVFYSRNMDRTYDLKGSKRTRFSSEAEDNPLDKGAVYLDSNLRKHNLSAPPLLVDKTSLEELEESLRRDSEFLRQQSIMDYSLLVGLDKENSTLVVAIIDFIRQYTWDKQLETLVKSSGIIGGKKEVGEEPTVISPDSYMRRFVSTITSYYHVVPTCDDWEREKAPGSNSSGKCF
ncbi:hypothetical protein BSKO_12722 [Bryopsis sp. KO-2023]|nr:hypothetical protein BSKO_12722 [Bryopsis sp. KO-2023]